MKCSILEVSLLLAVLNPGTAGVGDIPELVLSNGSSPVLLPCFSRSLTQIDEILWAFQPASGNKWMDLCRIDNKNPQCSSPLFPHRTLAETEGFRTGNYSLLFTATMEDAGNYDCFLYYGHKEEKMQIDLLVINVEDTKSIPNMVRNQGSNEVSVTPSGPIPHGSSVYLTCEMPRLSYFNSIDWSIEKTGKEIEIQWKLNRALIHEDKRHKFDFRSLNISNFKLPDAGRYTCTVRLKNGKTCSYSHLLEISDPSQNSKSNITVIAGAVVGVAVVVLAMILIGLLIKKKYKPADQNSAPVQNNEDNYATINLDALGKPGKGVRRSAEATTVYAEVKTN